MRWLWLLLLTGCIVHAQERLRIEKGQDIKLIFARPRYDTAGNSLERFMLRYDGGISPVGDDSMYVFRYDTPGTPTPGDSLSLFKRTSSLEPWSYQLGVRAIRSSAVFGDTLFERTTGEWAVSEIFEIFESDTTEGDTVIIYIPVNIDTVIIRRF
jgi:hypothetical protein